jgi:hypothetical protein
MSESRASAGKVFRVELSERSEFSERETFPAEAPEAFVDAGDRLRATIWCDGDLFHRLEGSDLFVHVRSKKGGEDE